MPWLLSDSTISVAGSSVAVVGSRAQTAVVARALSQLPPTPDDGAVRRLAGRSRDCPKDLEALAFIDLCDSGLPSEVLYIDPAYSLRKRRDRLI